MRTDSLAYIICRPACYVGYPSGTTAERIAYITSRPAAGRIATAYTTRWLRVRRKINLRIADTGTDARHS